VEVVDRATVTGVVRDDDGRVTGVEIERAGHRRVTAPMVVGADGIRSTVAAAVGAEPSPLGGSAGTCLYGYVDGRVTEGFEWFYGAGLTAGLIPTDAVQTLAFVCHPIATPYALPTTWPELVSLLRDAWPAGADMLAGGVPDGRLRRYRGAVGYRRRAHGPGWALVGDAGYYVDPLSSHGMSQALRDAELLARALTSSDVGAGMVDYERRRDDLSAPIACAVESIAAFDWDERSVRPRVLAMTSAMSDEVEALARLDESSRPFAVR
jgi:2-polyprenyl-6-methoxyphenol hydroxylase-like FAD-dependent oxidoreductase